MDAEVKSYLTILEHSIKHRTQLSEFERFVSVTNYLDQEINRNFVNYSTPENTTVEGDMPGNRPWKPLLAPPLHHTQQKGRRLHLDDIYLPNYDNIQTTYTDQFQPMQRRGYNSFTRNFPKQNHFNGRRNYNGYRRTLTQMHPFRNHYNTQYNSRTELILERDIMSGVNENWDDSDSSSVSDLDIKIENIKMAKKNEEKIKNTEVDKTNNDTNETATIKEEKVELECKKQHSYIKNGVDHVVLANIKVEKEEQEVNISDPVTIPNTMDSEISNNVELPNIIKRKGGDTTNSEPEIKKMKTEQNVTLSSNEIEINQNKIKFRRKRSKSFSEFLNIKSNQNKQNPISKLQKFVSLDNLQTLEYNMKYEDALICLLKPISCSGKLLKMLNEISRIENDLKRSKEKKRKEKNKVLIKIMELDLVPKKINVEHSKKPNEINVLVKEKKHKTSQENNLKSKPKEVKTENKKKKPDLEKVGKIIEQKINKQLKPVSSIKKEKLKKVEKIEKIYKKSLKSDQNKESKSADEKKAEVEKKKKNLELLKKKRKVEQTHEKKGKNSHKKESNIKATETKSKPPEVDLKKKLLSMPLIPSSPNKNQTLSSSNQVRLSDYKKTIDPHVKVRIPIIQLNLKPLRKKLQQPFSNPSEPYIVPLLEEHTTVTNVLNTNEEQCVTLPDIVCEKANTSIVAHFYKETLNLSPTKPYKIKNDSKTILEKTPVTKIETVDLTECEENCSDQITNTEEVVKIEPKEDTSVNTHKSLLNLNQQYSQITKMESNDSTTISSTEASGVKKIQSVNCSNNPKIIQASVPNNCDEMNKNCEPNTPVINSKKISISHSFKEMQSDGVTYIPAVQRQNVTIEPITQCSNVTIQPINSGNNNSNNYNTQRPKVTIPFKFGNNNNNNTYCAPVTTIQTQNGIQRSNSYNRADNIIQSSQIQPINNFGNIKSVLTQQTKNSYYSISQYISPPQNVQPQRNIMDQQIIRKLAEIFSQFIYRLHHTLRAQEEYRRVIRNMIYAPEFSNFSLQKFHETANKEIHYISFTLYSKLKPSLPDGYFSRDSIQVFYTCINNILENDYKTKLTKSFMVLLLNCLIEPCKETTGMPPYFKQLTVSVKSFMNRVNAKPCITKEQIQMVQYQINQYREIVARQNILQQQLIARTNRRPSLTNLQQPTAKIQRTSNLPTPPADQVLTYRISCDSTALPTPTTTASNTVTLFTAQDIPTKQYNNNFKIHLPLMKKNDDEEEKTVEAAAENPDENQMIIVSNNNTEDENEKEVEVTNDINKSDDEVIDLTWLDDEDIDQMEKEMELLPVKIEAVKQEDNPSTSAPSPSDSGIDSPPLSAHFFKHRLCICHKVAEFMCRCTYAMYCSRKCQIADWKRHKSICQKSFNQTVNSA